LRPTAARRFSTALIHSSRPASASRTRVRLMTFRGDGGGAEGSSKGPTTGGSRWTHPRPPSPGLRSRRPDRRVLGEPGDGHSGRSWSTWRRARLRGRSCSDSWRRWSGVARAARRAGRL